MSTSRILTLIGIIPALLLTTQAKAQTLSEKPAYFYCYSSGSNFGQDNVFFTPVLVAPFTFTDVTKYAMTYDLNAHIDKVWRWAGPNARCSKAFQTKKEAETAAAEQSKTYAEQYAQVLEVKRAKGHSISPRPDFPAWTGPSSERWASLRKQEEEAFVETNATPKAIPPNGAIVVADDDTSARAAANADYIAKELAAQKRKSAASAAIYKQRDAAEAARAKARAAARLEAYRKRCPSMRCQ